MEGDENSSVYHGMFKKRRRQTMVQGIMVNGDWVTDPTVVIKELFDFFMSIFNHFIELN